MSRILLINGEAGLPFRPYFESARAALLFIVAVARSIRSPEKMGKAAALPHHY